MLLSMGISFDSADGLVVEYYHSTRKEIPLMKRMIVLIMVMSALTFMHKTSCVASEPQRASSKPSPAAIVADILVLRPGGLIGTILGTAGFLISLPVTWPEKKTETVGEMLVITPLHFTFDRPLGKM